VDPGKGLVGSLKRKEGRYGDPDGVVAGLDGPEFDGVPKVMGSIPYLKINDIKYMV